MEIRMERTLKAVNGSINVTVPKGLVEELGWSKGDRVAFKRVANGLHLETAAPAGLKVHTIGYEGRTLEDFVDTLQKACVRRLLDVRELPLSRRKGFSKTPLREALGNAGIDYVHVRDLGAPKEVRKPYLAGGPYATFKAGYLGHLERHRVALDGVKWHAGEAATAIMCVERDHAECHRGIVGEELAREGVLVEHL